MKAPNKVKVFAWRVIQECLPSKQNLLKRKITENANCPFCNFPIEDCTHALIKCLDTRKVWQRLMPNIYELNAASTILDVALQMLHRGDEGLLSRFFLIAWSLWHRRNKWAIEKVMLDPFQVANNAINTFKPCLQARVEPSYTMHKTGCWQVPPHGFYKLNVDAALFFDLKKAGVGGVLRDERGEMVLAMSKAEHELHDPESVELVAILRGLQFILQLGIRKIVLESDSLLMVEALKANQDSLSLQGNMLKEVKNMMNCFEEKKVQHVCRSGNQVAHTLAKHAWSIPDVELWMGLVPAFLSQVYWLDSQNVRVENTL
ncbi:uncharacterized protein LOC122274515 [Carya illinoinensis]|uniref:uncharacterized protein LOC122274515 n=1 Tax=Carya illinoinensis TaxID=32201 RepID=UPI001C722DEE|nr:uncharacterized protein LOC122274515 [Carya illinoinensis]